MSKPTETLGPPSSAGFYETPKPEPAFASKAAADAWRETGRPELGEASGETGYTVADVRSAAKES